MSVAGVIDDYYDDDDGGATLEESGGGNRSVPIVVVLILLFGVLGAFVYHKHAVEQAAAGHAAGQGVMPAGSLAGTNRKGPPTTLGAFNPQQYYSDVGCVLLSSLLSSLFSASYSSSSFCGG